MLDLLSALPVPERMFRWRETAMRRDESASHAMLKSFFIVHGLFSEPITEDS